MLWADPSDNVTPDQPLYQRVKKLEDYGLLDPRDKAVLDQGLVVNRLELAFYVEKAKARLDTPESPVVVPAPGTTDRSSDLAAARFASACSSHANRASSRNANADRSDCCSAAYEGSRPSTADGPRSCGDSSPGARYQPRCFTKRDR